METRYREYATRRRYNAGVGFGVVVIVIGALLLLNNLGIFRIHDLVRFWPVILIAFGVVKALDARDSAGQIGGGVLALVGAWLLADRLHLFYFTFREFWPVLLIAFGVLLLWKHVDRPHHIVTEGIGERVIFAGMKRQVTGEFTGGRLDVVFAGYEVDLRQAIVTEDQVVMQLHVVFGGVEITIPENWYASVEGKAVFGAFEDKTRHPLPNTPGSKRLIVTGDVVFGGVVIKN